MLDHYANSNWQADLIALTGDLIQDDDPASYDHFPEMLAELGLPVLCIPGNHDVRAAMRQKLSDPPFSYCGSLRAGQWQVVGIDSCVEGQAGGRVADDELERLFTVLANSDAGHHCVCLHHPPVDVHSKWLDSVGLDAGEELLDRLRAAGSVRLVLFGHVHQAVEQNHRGIAIVGTPSTCRQFMPGAETFAVDHRPPAYRRVDLNDGGSVRSELVWVD